jgi:hypothetical protein
LAVDLAGTTESLRIWFQRVPTDGLMSNIGVIVANWAALNVALAAALLARRDRPKVQEKLLALLLKGTPVTATGAGGRPA